MIDIRHQGYFSPYQFPPHLGKALLWISYLIFQGSRFGNDGVWTIIDRFSKQAHFIPVKKSIKIDHMACIFMTDFQASWIAKKTIVSDKDPMMTSLFWYGVFDNMGIKLDFSSAFHPQTDGQSEIANSTLLDLLKCYVGEQKTEWETYLPLVEFAHNNTIDSSTRKAPFEVMYGKVILPPILKIKDEIFATEEYVREIGRAHV